MFDFGSGIGAAKRSFLTVGLPMMVGAFIVALLAAFFAGKSE